MPHHRPLAGKDSRRDGQRPGFGTSPIFLPTVAEVVGFEAPGGIDGESILPVLLDDASKLDQRFLYWGGNAGSGGGGSLGTLEGPFGKARNSRSSCST